MNPKALTHKSKHISLVLRHDPASVGLTLDKAGWVSVDTFITAMKMTREELDEVVAENSKKRFEFSEDGSLIRASQGHSVDVELGYEAKEPPQYLWHGTSDVTLPLIQEKGILRMDRHQVHLSLDEGTALIVARRRPGHAIKVRVLAGQMHEDGHKFYQSTNGVWLTDHVPPKYLEIGDNNE